MTAVAVSHMPFFVVSFLNTLLSLAFRYDPTIEDSYCKHIEVDGQDYTLELTDTAGQSEYRDQWDDQFMRYIDSPFFLLLTLPAVSLPFYDPSWTFPESDGPTMVYYFIKAN